MRETALRLESRRRVLWDAGGDFESYLSSWSDTRPPPRCLLLCCWLLGLGAAFFRRAAVLQTGGDRFRLGATAAWATLLGGVSVVAGSRGSATI